MAMGRGKPSDESRIGKQTQLMPSLLKIDDHVHLTHRNGSQVRPYALSTGDEMEQSFLRAAKKMSRRERNNFEQFITKWRQTKHDAMPCSK